MNVSELLFHNQVMPITGNCDGIPVREDVLYTDRKGQPNRSVRRNAENLISKLREPLRRALAPQETVLHVMRVQVPLGVVEQLTMSWLMLRLVRAALIITDRRLLHINLSSDGEWRGAVRSLPWENISQAKVGLSILSRTLKLTYSSGKKEQYTRLTRRDAKKLKLLLPLLLRAENLQSATSNGFVALCPDCFNQLQEDQFLCSHCGLTFRDLGTLTKRALLIPGGGYFYCKLTAAGVLAGFFELIFLFEFFVCVYSTFFAPAGIDRTDPGTGLSAMLLFIFLLALEKAIMIYHCRRFIKEYIPLPRSDSRNFAVGAGV